LYSCFVSQPSEFYRHNPLCCFSSSVYCLFRYRLSPENFDYTLINRLRGVAWPVLFENVYRDRVQPLFFICIRIVFFGLVGLGEHEEHCHGHMRQTSCTEKSCVITSCLISFGNVASYYWCDVFSRCLYHVLVCLDHHPTVASQLCWNQLLKRREY